MIDPDVLLASAAHVLALMVLLWIVSLAMRDASIVDIAWGPAFVAIAAASFAIGHGAAPRRTLLLVLVALWGARLGSYLAWRNLGRGEDFRYRKMRAFWGARFWWVSLFTVFLLQGVLAWMVSAPIQLAMSSPQPARLGALDWAGVALFTVGFLFESVGDLQLARFKADPGNAGKVLDSGLWAWTRHPNYFGDFLVWWSFFLIALATPRGFLAAIGPLLMSFLLLRVSGVPMLERSLRRKRPGYDDYRARVPAFFPRPPSAIARSRTAR
jgi:steroid 5-alpha reductase family enzyme